MCLMRMGLIILHELGYLPFSQAGGALLFRLPSKLYEHTSVLITTNLTFPEWNAVFGIAKMTKALLLQLTRSTLQLAQMRCSPPGPTRSSIGPANPHG